MGVRAWRCSPAGDGRGVLVWFDPYLEDPSIRELTEEEKAIRLDRYGSVSALDEDEERALSAHKIPDQLWLDGFPSRLEGW